LRIGQLPRFELRLTKRAAPFVWARRLELPLQVAQLLQRAVAPRARLTRVLPPQLARRIAHLLGDVAHPLAVAALAGLSALSALAALPGLSCLS
jgi:hypothetical protein